MDKKQLVKVIVEYKWSAIASHFDSRTEYTHEFGKGWRNSFKAELSADERMFAEWLASCKGTKIVADLDGFQMIVELEWSETDGQVP